MLSSVQWRKRHNGGLYGVKKKWAKSTKRMSININKIPTKLSQMMRTTRCNLKKNSRPKTQIILPHLNRQSFLSHILKSR
uniref:Uncharacterized protein n=1 Tax=Octopus bimaculoides TaxID=37653 RepID=A0A0L8GM77_OCTBM